MAKSDRDQLQTREGTGKAAAALGGYCSHHRSNPEHENLDQGELRSKGQQLLQQSASAEARPQAPGCFPQFTASDLGEKVALGKPVGGTQLPSWLHARRSAHFHQAAASPASTRLPGVLPRHRIRTKHCPQWGPGGNGQSPALQPLFRKASPRPQRLAFFLFFLPLNSAPLGRGVKPIHFSLTATRWPEPYLLLRRVPNRENRNNFWVACTHGWPGAGPSGTAAPGLYRHPAGVPGAPRWVQVGHTAAAGAGHQLHPFGTQIRRGNKKRQLKPPGLSWGSDNTCSARPARVQAKDKRAEQGKASETGGKAGVSRSSAGRFGAKTNPRTVEKSSGRRQSPTASPGHPPP